jgi:tetratricopeptide (TPR) repeat protein
MVRPVRFALFLFSLLMASLTPASASEVGLAGIDADIEQAAGYYLDGEPSLALPILQAAIRGLETQLGNDSEKLVTPLGFLGASFLELDRNQDSLDAIERARRLGWQHEGRDNVRQIPLIHVEAEALKRLGRMQEAGERLNEAVELTEKRHGQESLESGLSLGRLAEWKAAQGDFDGALMLFSRAIDLAHAASGGKDSAEMLPLLQAMAQVFLAEGDVPGRALPLIRRVVMLTDDEDNEFGQETRAQARLLFGGMLMRFSHEREAMAAYQEAWEIASQHRLDSLLGRLAEHEKVAGALIPVAETPEQRDYFVFRFRIESDGRPARVTLLESNAEPIRARWAVQQFRGLRFRPPMVDGQAQSIDIEAETFVY